MPNYSQNPRVRALQEAILTGSSSNCLGGGGGFGNHKVRRLGVNASARFRRSYGEIGDCEHSIISLIYLIVLSHWPKAVVIKTVISLGSVSSAGSPVPWFNGLQFHRLVLPLLS